MAETAELTNGRAAELGAAVSRQDSSATISGKARGNGKPKKSKAKKRSGKSNRGGAAPRKFPAFTLEEALRIPGVIKQFNAGNEWSSEEVAKAVDLSVKNPKFYYLTASSRDYGLTTGSSNTPQIALTDLGRRLVYPTSPEMEAAAVREALFTVSAFKAVFEYYKGGELPDIKYLSNTLETQFQLPPDLHEDFRKFYNESRAYLLKFSERLPEASQPVKAGGGSKPVIVGEPKSKTTLRAFVIMPFVEKTDRFQKGFFDEVLRNLITPAGVEAGFKVETAKRDGSDIIQSTIVNELLEADLVVVDLTEHNPNVLFELGLRIAFEKPIALIKADGTPPVFDVDAMLRVTSYNPALWKSTLEKDIPKISAHIKGAWESRENPQTWLKLLRKR